MGTLIFEAKILQQDSWTIIQLPTDISALLPSRGMVMVEGTINTIGFILPLEPDGMKSHWLSLDGSLCEEAHLEIGQTASLSIHPLKNWIEAEVPEDLKAALIASNVFDQWDATTTKARWEWIRWIRFTNNPQTRSKRINTACSMLSAGKKRPCCFDQSRCTEPSISKSGVLSLLDQ